MLDDNRSLQDIKEGPFGYLLIALFVLVLYIAIIGIYLNFNNTVLPIGDPFTYTTGFFNLLDTAHIDFWNGVRMAFAANWYWLINIMIVLFSPVIVKEPFSLSLVNFIIWGLAMVSFFRLARFLRFSAGFSFIIAWLIWLFPINYGFLDYTSVPVMGLDAMFMGILNVAIANIIVFAIEPKRIKNALLAGLSVGLAIWGRGNSLLVVLMVIFCPLSLLIYKLWKEKTRGGVFQFIIFTLITASMTVYFYIKKWGPIATYYTGHAEFIRRHHWNWADALPYIKNVPGFFFWRFENSATTIAITWVAHFIVLFSLFLTFYCNVNSHKKLLKFLSITGAFIYFCTYFLNIILFTDPLMNIYNCLLIYAPMRIGLTFSIFSILAFFVLRWKINVKQWIIFPMAVFGVIYGVSLTKMQTPRPIPGVPTPVEIESFAKNLDSLLNGGTVSVLWYRHYNPNILKYYRIKNNLPEIRLYMNKYYNDIWQPYFYTEEKRRKVREEIRKHFEEATLIIIPEHLDYYGPENPYSFYHFRDEIANYLNSPESPRFVVRMSLKEYGHLLLVLQRQEDADGQGVPFQLPYGLSTSAPNPKDTYNPLPKRAINVKKDSKIKVSNNAGKSKEFFIPPKTPVMDIRNIKISVSGKSDLYLYDRAFDNSVDPNSFWEAIGQYPFWAMFKYKNKVKINKYFLAVGESTVRMPTEWQLQGSEDGNSWVTLDARSNETGWEENEKREYLVSSPKEHKFYRLYFTTGGIHDIFRIYEIGLEE